jgi:hypothetical protein
MSHSSALSSPNCPLTDPQKTHPLALLAHASDHGLLLPSGKLDHSVWDSGPSDFPGLESYYHAGGQRTCNNRLLHSCLHGQNLQQVLTIPGESASVAVAPMVCTTLPKEDKVGTSSVKAFMTQSLVARPGSKVPNDNLVDDDPDLLNFDVAESAIVCRMSSRLQMCWSDSGKPDNPVWYSGWSSFCAP